MIFIDSNPYSYVYQFDNGIPIIPYKGSRKDKQLKYLYCHLKIMLKEENVRAFNIKHFKLVNIKLAW